MKFTKYLRLTFFIILFAFGFLMILNSRIWDWGTLEAMYISGGILCLFSGAGILCELYKK